MKQLWLQVRTIFAGAVVVGLVVGIIVGLVLASMFASSFPEWTGLSPYIPPTPQPDGFERGKTLWDWLQLLLVPLVLAIGGFWLTRSENRYALKLQERREKETRDIEDQRARQVTEAEEQRVQEAVLQDYLDQMTPLLLNWANAADSNPRDSVTFRLARVRTLTALRRLDKSRRGIVVRFLSDLELLAGETRVIDLRGFDLSDVIIEQANFDGADLQGTILRGARLIAADFTRAKLNEADLSEAQLPGSSLRQANLRHARLVHTDLLAVHAQGAHFDTTDLTMATLDNGQLMKVSMIQTILTQARLVNADLNDANLVVV